MVTCRPTGNCGATPLGDTLIATSPTFGWRDEAVAVRETIRHELNLFVAIAERAVLIAYEALIGAAEITM